MEDQTTTTPAGVADLGRILDRVDAGFIVADLEDGKSLSGASMALTLRNYQREDFAAFRAAHGDRATVAAVQYLASH